MVAAVGGALGSLLPAEELVVDFLDAAEFVDGLRVIVDAEVDVAVVCAAVAPAIADDEECGGLLAAFVATGSLACGEGVDEADGEVFVRDEEGFRHGIDDFGAGEDVALDGVVFAGESTCR